MVAVALVAPEVMAGVGSVAEVRVAVAMEEMLEAALEAAVSLR